MRKLTLFAPFLLFVFIRPNPAYAEGTKIYLVVAGRMMDAQNWPQCTAQPPPTNTPCPCPPPSTPTPTATHSQITNTPTNTPMPTDPPTITPTPTNMPSPTPMACSDPIDLHEPLIGTLDQWGQRVVGAGGADHPIGLGGQVVDNSVYDEADAVVLNTWALHDHGFVSDNGCVLAYVCAPPGGIRIRATAWDGRFFIVPFEAGLTINQSIAAMRVTLEQAHGCTNKIVYHELVRHGDPVMQMIEAWMEPLQYLIGPKGLDPGTPHIDVPSDW